MSLPPPTWPEGYTLTREEMLSLVKDLDRLSAAFRSNFLGLVATCSRKEAVRLLPNTWPPQVTRYILPQTGEDERELLKCFTHLRDGAEPLLITAYGISLLWMIAEFYPDEINEHIGPFNEAFAHLRAPPKPKADKKAKKDPTDG